MDAYNLVNIVSTFAMAAILAIKWQEVARCIQEGGAAIQCVIFYYVVCAVAGLWSPAPEYAAFRAFEFLIFLLAIMLMVRRPDSFFQAERLALVSMGLILLVGIGGHIRLSGWGAFHTNRYSISAAVLFAYSFAELAYATGRRKRLLGVSSAMGLGGVLLGTSTGSNLAVAGGLIVLLILSPYHRRYVLLAAPALLLLMAQSDQLLAFILGGKSPEQVVGLAHRKSVWVTSWDLFMQRPVLGYGLNVATRQYSFLLSSHNAYLEALLGGGILGASVLYSGCLALLWDLGQSMRRHAAGSLGCCIAAVVYLINGVSTPTIGYVLVPHCIPFLFILAMYSGYVRCSDWRALAPLYMPPVRY